MTMNGLPSSYVCPSTVTWSSCMHSRSAACVFGEARLISSTRDRFAKTGPGRNSNSFGRWLKTFTPVTSEGSRSGVNWSRENDASSERASAFASIVFPTPGKSSRIRCPSLIRQRTQSRSVSAGAWTTVARLSTIRRIVSAADSTATACLSAASSIPSFEQRLGLVQDRGGDLLLRRLGDPPLALRRDHDHLVLVGVASSQGLAGHVLRGRGLDDLDLGRRRDGEVRGEQRHVGAAAARFTREGHAHPAGRAVAEEAHRVERLARPAGGDEDAAAGE